MSTNSEQVERDTAKRRRRPAGRRLEWRANGEAITAKGLIHTFCLRPAAAGGVDLTVQALGSRSKATLFRGIPHFEARLYCQRIEDACQQALLDIAPVYRQAVELRVRAAIRGEPCMRAGLPPS